MLILLFLLTFAVGILIHGTVIRLPGYLHVVKHKKHPWKNYFPFFSLRFLMLDGVLFISSFIIFFHSNNMAVHLSALIFTWLLITSGFIDFEHQILPDEITYILLWLGLLFSCWPVYINANMAIISAVAAYCGLFMVSCLFKIIRKKDGLGQGDVKLFAAIAAWTGIFSLPLILLIASLSAIIFIVMRKLCCGVKCSSPAAFGPFLAFAGWLILLWGNDINAFMLG